MNSRLRTRLREKRALLRRSREGLAPYLEISQIRERLDAIEGRLEMLEDDLELIEDNLDINSSMADDKNTVGIGSSAPVGVGSTADVGVGSTAPPVGVGSTAPAGTTHTDPDTSKDGEQDAPDPDFS